MANVVNLVMYRFYHTHTYMHTCLHTHTYTLTRYLYQSSPVQAQRTQRWTRQTQSLLLWGWKLPESGPFHLHPCLLPLHGSYPSPSPLLLLCFSLLPDLQPLVLQCTFEALVRAQTRPSPSLNPPWLPSALRTKFRPASCIPHQHYPTFSSFFLQASLGFNICFYMEFCSPWSIQALGPSSDVAVSRKLSRIPRLNQVLPSLIFPLWVITVWGWGCEPREG